MNQAVQYFATIFENFKEFILLTVILTILLMIYFQIVDKRYTLKRTANLYHLFLRMDILTKYQVIFFYLSFIYMVSLVIRFSPLSIYHILVYGFFACITILLSVKKKGLFLLNLFNSVVCFVILQVLNILLNYLMNVYFNQYYLLIYIVMGVALVLYCLFILAYQILFVVSKRKG